MTLLKGMKNVTIQWSLLWNKHTHLDRPFLGSNQNYDFILIKPPISAHYPDATTSESSQKAYDFASLVTTFFVKMFSF
jgi:hypothetical protein